jgi:hypothetical protein
MRPPEQEALPLPLRNRAKAAFAKADSVGKTYHGLLLQQETALYLAALALAEYRGLGGPPTIEAEMAIASLERRATFSAYTTVLIECIKSTNGQSLMKDLPDAPFVDARKLAVLMKEAATHRRTLGGRLWEAIQSVSSEPISFEKYLRSLGDFRNKAFAHTDWHGLDDADDFFDEAFPILLKVASELLCHPVVKHAFQSLQPATVTNVHDYECPPRYEVRLDDDRGTFEIEHSPAQWAADHAPFHTNERVLVRVVDDTEPEIVGSYWRLGDGMAPLKPAVEATIGAILADAGPAEALAALRGFADQVGKDDPNRKEWIAEELVDDIVICALEEFKFNGDNKDHAIPRNLLPLLEYTSDQLPARIVADVERFESVSVRYPATRPTQPVEELLARSRSGSVASRTQAAADMGSNKDHKILEELITMAKRGERRAVRKQALLSIAAREGVGLTTKHVEELMRIVTYENRSDPEMACCALIGLAAVDGRIAVDFLVEFAQSDAAYACTETASWALASLAQRRPRLVQERSGALLELAADEHGDPYTRGTVIYCLGKLTEAGLAAEIAALLHPEEHPFVLEDACAALGALGDPCGVEPLLAVLASESVDGAFSDLCVKRAAIRSLGTLSGPRAQEALARYEAPPGCRFVERALAEARHRLAVEPGSGEPEVGDRVGA